MLKKKKNVAVKAAIIIYIVYYTWFALCEQQSQKHCSVLLSFLDDDDDNYYLSLDVYQQNKLLPLCCWYARQFGYINWLLLFLLLLLSTRRRTQKLTRLGTNRSWWAKADATFVCVKKAAPRLTTTSPRVFPVCRRRAPAFFRAVLFFFVFSALHLSCIFFYFFFYYYFIFRCCFCTWSIFIFFSCCLDGPFYSTW